MTTTKTETEMLREDLELTRQHLADTVQELSRQLNFPRRIKDSAVDAGHRAKLTAGEMGERAKQVPAMTRQHPRTAAAAAGAVALTAGATAWLLRRHK